MREILFKAKRKNWHELSEEEWWIEGYPVKYQPCASKNEYVYGIVPTYASALYIIEIDPETLCQYIGKNDKNGKLIWENDIIRVENSIDEGTGMVEFYGGMWYVDKGVNNSLYDIMLYDDEAEVCVMGNIFDNPELLGQDGG